MKIISKYKDYYDYLSGIYGIDEKIILDRTDFKHCNSISSNRIFRLYIAGYIVEGICVDNIYYYGNELKKFELDQNKLRYWFSKHKKRDYDKSIYIKNKLLEGWIYTEPLKDKDEYNKKQNCAIILNENDKYPILRELELSKFIKPTIIYQWIYDYLSSLITDKEKISDMSNENKILAKGFDLKTSFRNIK